MFAILLVQPSYFYLSRYLCFPNRDSGLCVWWPPLLWCHGGRRGSLMERENHRELVTAPGFAAIWYQHNVGVPRGLLIAPQGRKPWDPAPPWSVLQLPGLLSLHEEEEAAAWSAEPPPLPCRLVQTWPPPGTLQEGEGMTIGQGCYLWASGVFNN